MRPIAVVTNNIPSTFHWLRRDHGVDEINVAHRTGVNKKTGQVYVLILDKEQACAWEFAGVLISPFYESLEQFVRSRIR
jgi:hypothetical protein